MWRTTRRRQGVPLRRKCDGVINFIVGVLGAFASVVMLCILFRDLGYRTGARDGYAKGYQEGFAAARELTECWWMRLETEVDQARQEIWREEG